MPAQAALQPLSPADVLNQSYLEARAKLLDLAAIFDRLDRGQPASNDPRVELLKQALALLNDSTRTTTPNRAERLQLHFSLKYDDQWLKNFQPSR